MNRDLKWTEGNELKYLKEVLENKHKSNPFCDRLERAIAEKYGVEYAISVNSGTSGLHAALVACGIGFGDQVITSPFTVFVDGSMPIMVGAEPVFADVEYDTHNIDPKDVESLITDDTKAIMPISYHGCPYDIDSIMSIAKKHNLFVIEDDAQAMIAEYDGRYVGKDADITMLSFERTKHVACGEGGMLLTNNPVLAERARKFAGMGFKNLKADTNEMSATTPLSFQDPHYKRNDSLGLNYRLPEFCAAVALAQFERVEEKVKLRRDIAELYDNIFNKYKDIFEPQKIPGYSKSSYFTYPVKTDFTRKEWMQFHDFIVKQGGDDFYGGMGIVYEEPYFVSQGYYRIWKGKCPIAELIQRGLIQFKTNYRTISEAKKNIDRLEELINIWVS